MRIVFLTTELTHPFSGNGTASQSFMRALVGQGHDVFAVTCSPTDKEPVVLDGSAIGVVASHPGFRGVAIPVETWRVHGRCGPHEEFARGVAAAAEGLECFGRADVVLGVDWEVAAAYVRLGDALRGAPLVLYCYRVYSHNSDNTPETARWYEVQEKEAIQLAQGRVLVLCRTDRQRVLDAVPEADVRVVLPGLRADVATCVPPHLPRKYVLCCCRVAPEKNIEGFVNMVEQASGYLTEHGYKPLMVGAVADRNYADPLHERVRRVGGEVVDFLPSAELCRVMAQAVLNVHPALNEPYGMTIVECAAMGCPSLLLAPIPSDIGAVDLLTTDGVLTGPQCLATLLDQPSRLADVAAIAKEKALGYDEGANARHLVRCLTDLVR
eukprot:Sspe_Gene.116052::Locus_104361_Transcript_1_1_Confidence_1.000_Length_1191::g.116052::m.116052